MFNSCIHHLTQKEHNFYQRRRRDHEEEGKNALTGLALCKPQRNAETKRGLRIILQWKLTFP